MIAPFIPAAHVEWSRRVVRHVHGARICITTVALCRTKDTLATLAERRTRAAWEKKTNDTNELVFAG